MKLRDKITNILNSLGLLSKVKSKSLTDEDLKSFADAFEKEYGISYSAAIDEDDANQAKLADRQKAIDKITASIESKSKDDENEDDDDEEDDDKEKKEKDKKDKTEKSNSLEKGIDTILASNKELAASNAVLQAKLEKMIPQATADIPESVVSRQINAFGGITNETHLFGIDNSLFDMTKRWNKIAANPSVANESVNFKKLAKSFEKETLDFASSLSARYKFLKENNQFEFYKQNGTFNNDLNDLSKAGLGDQYVVIRQDALIAQLISIPSVREFFPMVSNVEDRLLMTTAFFDELSQGYQAGRVFKGGMQLKPELAYVDDAMFKANFGPMKEIERKYIAYLNTSGSDPMKWGMIEWQLLQMYKKLTYEQNERMIRGCYTKPEEGVPSSYLNAGTGLIYTMLRYYHELKVLPHSGIYDTYDEQDMIASVKAFVKDVIESLGVNMNLQDKYIYINDRHKHWWLEAIRKEYGTQSDFTGVDSYANVVPEYGMKIKWLPNMDFTDRLMFIQVEGNFKTLENVPGEMLAVDFDKSMENVDVWSVWKEGFSAEYAGKPHENMQALVDNNFEFQQIFMNKPSVAVDADATTIDGKLRYWFGTGANTQATELTDITNPRAGVVYVIECDDEANATTIAKAGKFADITKAYKPTKVGDYIMVQLTSKDTFRELERCEGGVRNINVDVQPNMVGPGGR